MFDDTTREFGGGEPPKPDAPKPVTLHTGIIKTPIFDYLLEGPDDTWLLARIEKLPFPSAYVLSLLTTDAQKLLHRDAFWVYRDKLMDSDDWYNDLNELLATAVRCCLQGEPLKGWSLCEGLVRVEELIDWADGDKPSRRGGWRSPLFVRHRT